MCIAKPNAERGVNCSVQNVVLLVILIYVPGSLARGLLPYLWA